MSKPKLNRPPLVKGDIVRWNHEPSWEAAYGSGPFIVSKVRREMDHYDHLNHLITVERLNDGYVLPSDGDMGWWMGYFIKDEFLSAVKHAKKEAHDNPLPAGRKRARQHHENG